VHERYDWDPQNRRNVNADIARRLLERGNFLKHGTDEEVSGKVMGNEGLTLYPRVIQTILRILRYLASLSIFFTQVLTPWQTFSWKFSKMKYRVPPSPSPPLLYIFRPYIFYCILKYN